MTSGKQDQDPEAVGAKDWLVDSTCSNLRAHLLNALGTERPAEDVGQDALADVRRQALEVLDNATTDTDGGPSLQARTVAQILTLFTEQVLRLSESQQANQLHAIRSRLVPCINDMLAAQLAQAQDRQLSPSAEGPAGPDGIHSTIQSLLKGLPVPLGERGGSQFQPGSRVARVATHSQSVAVVVKSQLQGVMPKLVKAARLLLAGEASDEQPGSGSSGGIQADPAPDAGPCDPVVLLERLGAAGAAMSCAASSDPLSDGQVAEQSETEALQQHLMTDARKALGGVGPACLRALTACSGDQYVTAARDATALISAATLLAGRLQQEGLPQGSPLKLTLLGGLLSQQRTPNGGAAAAADTAAGSATAHIDAALGTDPLLLVAALSLPGLSELPWPSAPADGHGPASTPYMSWLLGIGLAAVARLEAGSEPVEAAAGARAEPPAEAPAASAASQIEGPLASTEGSMFGELFDEAAQAAAGSGASSAALPERSHNSAAQLQQLHWSAALGKVLAKLAALLRQDHAQLQGQATHLPPLQAHILVRLLAQAGTQLQEGCTADGPAWEELRTGPWLSWTSEVPSGMGLQALSDLRALVQGGPLPPGTRQALGRAVMSPWQAAARGLGPLPCNPGCGLGQPGGTLVLQALDESLMQASRKQPSSGPPFALQLWLDHVEVILGLRNGSYSSLSGPLQPGELMQQALHPTRAALLRLAAHTLDSADRAVLLAALMQATTCMQQSAAAQESLPQQQATSSGSAALQQVWAAGLASLLSCTTYVAAVAGGGQPQPCVTAQIQRAVQADREGSAAAEENGWGFLWACVQADIEAGSEEQDQQRQVAKTALAGATHAETWAAASGFLSGLAGAQECDTADRDVAASFQHVTAVLLLQCQQGLAGDRSQAGLMQACAAAEQALLHFQMLQTGWHQHPAQVQGQLSASHVPQGTLLRLRHAAAVMLQQAQSSSPAPEGRQSMLLGLEQLADGLAVAAAAVAAQGGGSLAQAADAALLSQAVHLWAQAAALAAQEPGSVAQAASLAASLLCAVGPVARSTTEALLQELLAEGDSSGLLSPEQLQKLFQLRIRQEQVAALEGCGQLLPVLHALEDATALPELPSQAWPASQPALGGLHPAGQGRARWYPTAVAARRSAGCQAALLRMLQSAVRYGWSPFEAAEDKLVPLASRLYEVAGRPLLHPDAHAVASQVLGSVSPFDDTRVAQSLQELHAAEASRTQSHLKAALGTHNEQAASALLAACFCSLGNLLSAQQEPDLSLLDSLLDVRGTGSCTAAAVVMEHLTELAQAGAEGPSGARAHLAAVLGHDAEKLAQWLFASMAGPQVPARLSTAARHLLAVLLHLGGPAGPQQAGAQLEEQASLAPATAQDASDLPEARTVANFGDPLVTAADRGLRITTNAPQQPEDSPLAEADAPGADQQVPPPHHQQQQPALLQALLQALPKLLRLAAAAAAGPGEEPSQPSGASGTSSMASEGMGGQPSGSSLGLAGLRSESSLDTQLPESRAPLANEPMTALLTLILSCVGQQGVAGLRLLLDLPCQVAGQLAEILKPEQGMATAAHLLPVLRFVQAVVHQAWQRGPAATAAQGRGPEEPDQAAEVSPREGAAPAPSVEGAASGGAQKAASDAAGAQAAEAVAAPGQQEQAARAAQAGTEAGAEPAPGSQASGDEEASGQEQEVSLEAELARLEDEVAALDWGGAGAGAGALPPRALPAAQAAAAAAATATAAEEAALDELTMNQLIEGQLQGLEVAGIPAMPNGGAGFAARHGRGRGRGGGRGAAGRAFISGADADMVAAMMELVDEDPALRRALISGGRGRGSAAAAVAASPLSGGGNNGAPVELVAVRNEDGLLQCSFSRSGESFVQQHWYYCYTCNLVDSRGCCGACAAMCHAGHDVVYSSRSRFFCDCGAGAPRCVACKCLQPVPLSEDPTQTPPEASGESTSPGLRGGDDILAAGDPFTLLNDWDHSMEESLVLEDLWQIPPAADEDLFGQNLVDRTAGLLHSLLQQDPAVAGQLVACLQAVLHSSTILMDRLRSAAQEAQAQARQCDGPATLCPQAPVSFVEAPELLQVLHQQKLSSMCARSSAGAEAETVPGREIKDAVSLGLVHQQAVAGSSPLGLLAAARGRQVFMVDVAAYAATLEVDEDGEGLHSTGDGRLQCSSRHSARFDVVSLVFDACAGQRLLVAGLRVVQVWTVKPGGAISDRLPVKLPEQGAAEPNEGAPPGAYEDIVLQAQWLPGSSTRVAVTLPHGLYVYDLSTDARQSILRVTAGPAAKLLASAAVGELLVQGHTQLIAALLTRQGDLFTARLAVAPLPTGGTAHLLAVQASPGLAMAADSQPQPACAEAGAAPAPGKAALAGSTSAEADHASTSQPLEVLSMQAPPAAQPAAEDVQEALYGKSIAWCPAASLFAVCLGSSGKRALDMQLLVALSGDGSVAAVSRLQHADADAQGAPENTEAEEVSADSDSAESMEEAETGEESEADSQTSNRRRPGGLQAICRFQEVQVLPPARRALRGPSLLLGLGPQSGPSAGSAHALVLEKGCAASNANLGAQATSGCTVVAQSLEAQVASGSYVSGAAGVQLPLMTTALVVLLDSSGHVSVLALPGCGPIDEGVAAAAAPAEAAALTATGSTQAGAAEGGQAREDTGTPTVRRRDRRYAVAFAQDQPGELPGSPMPAAARLRRDRLLSHAVLAASEGGSVAGAAGSTGDSVAATEAAAGGTDDPKFPVDFFENVRCITAEVRLAGDIVHAGGGEGARRALSSPSSYLEAPSAAGLLLTVKPADASMAIVGFRLFTGSSGAAHVPKEVQVAGRTVRLKQAGQRRWHSIPLTDAEALATHPEVILEIGPVASGSAKPHLDSLEVYGKPRADVAASAAAESRPPAAAQISTETMLRAAATSVPSLISPTPSDWTGMEYLLSQALLTAQSLWDTLQGTSAPELEGASPVAADLAELGPAAARQVLLQCAQETAPEWQPNSALNCAAWTLLANFGNFGPGTPKLPELAQGVDISALLAAAASVEACCQDKEPWPLWPDAHLQQLLCVLAHVMFITDKRPGSLVEFSRMPALHSSSEVAQQRANSAEAAPAPDASASPDGSGAGQAGLDLLAAGPAPTAQGPAAQLAQAVVGSMAAVLHALQQRAGMARLHAAFVGRMAQMAVGLVLALTASGTGGEGDSVQGHLAACLAVDLMECPLSGIGTCAAEVLMAALAPSSQERLLVSPVKLNSQQQQELAGSVLHASMGRLGGGKGHGLEQTDAFRLLSQLAAKDLLSKQADAGNFAAGIIAALLHQIGHLAEHDGETGEHLVLGLALAGQIGAAAEDAHEKEADVAAAGKVQAAFLEAAKRLLPLLLTTVLKTLEDVLAPVGAGTEDTDLPQAAAGKAPGCGSLLAGPVHDVGLARMVKLEKDHLLASPGGAQGQPLVAVTAALHVAACIADSLGGQLLSDTERVAWEQALFKVLHCDALSKARKPCRKLLNALCGRHSGYRNAKTMFRIQQKLQVIRHLDAALTEQPGTYRLQAQLTEAAAGLLEVAEGRVQTWIRFLLDQEGAPDNAMAWLVTASLRWESEPAAQAVTGLLALALPKMEAGQTTAKLDRKALELRFEWLLPQLAAAPHREDTPSSSSSQVTAPAAAATAEGGVAGPGGGAGAPATPSLTSSLLAHVIVSYGLGATSEALRKAACSLVKGAWLFLAAMHMGDGSGAPKHRAWARSVLSGLLRLLLRLAPQLSGYGDFAGPFWEALTWVLKADTAPSNAGSRAAGTSTPQGEGLGSARSTPSRSAPEDAKRKAETLSLKTSGVGCLVKELWPEVLPSMLQALRDHNAVLCDHPHARDYSLLEKLTDCPECLLEAPAPQGSLQPERKFASSRLESLEAEVKYSGSRITVRLSSTYYLKSLTLRVHSLKKARMVRRLKVHFCAHPVSELSELKTRSDLWQQAATMTLKPYQVDARHSFPLPIPAACLMVELTDFWDNLSEASAEVLQCPRCNQLVTDPFGVCRYCHENAYQCRHCRNINYEDLDAFLCNECGHCRFGRLDFTVLAAPCTAWPTIRSEDDMQRALGFLELESDSLQRTRAALASTAKPVETALRVWQGQAPRQEAAAPSEQETTAGAAEAAPSADAGAVAAPTAAKGVNRAVAALGSAYVDKCRPAHAAVAHSTLALAGLRASLARYLKQQGGAAQQQLGEVALAVAPTQDYRYAHLFLGGLLPCLMLVARAGPTACATSFVKAGAIEELLGNNLKRGPLEARNAASALLQTLGRQGESGAMPRLLALTRARVMYCIQNHAALDVAAVVSDELSLLAELAAASSSAAAGTAADVQEWEAQLRLVVHLLLAASGPPARSPPVAEHVLAPCLKMLLLMIGGSEVQAAPSNGPTRGPAPTGVPAEGGRAPTARGGRRAGAAAATEPAQHQQSPRSLPPQAVLHGGQPRQPVSLQQFAEGRTGFGDYLRQWRGAPGGLTGPQKTASRLAQKWRRRAALLASSRHPPSVTQPCPEVPQSAAAPPAQAASAEAINSGGPGLGAMPAAAAASPLLERGALIGALLLNPANKDVREQTVELLRRMCLGTSHLRFRLLARLMALLPQASSAGTAASSFFALLADLLQDQVSASHVIATGGVAVLLHHILQHVDAFCCQEHGAALRLTSILRPAGEGADFKGSPTSGLSQQDPSTAGYTLTHLVKALQLCLAAPSAGRAFRGNSLLQQATLAVAGLATLVVCRTQLTMDAEDDLQELLQTRWVAASSAAREAFAAASAQLLVQLWRAEAGLERAAASPVSKPASGLPAQLAACVLEQMCWAIKPEVAEVAYLLQLDKSPTQEEFIRGHMTHNPYTSLEVGPLMRDVKNFVCRELDMEGLVEDDFGMELLVCGNIISLNLPVRLVFECVWRPSLRGAQRGSVQQAPAPAAGAGTRMASPLRGEMEVVGPPMQITYRLQGLDGEATEPITEQLREPAAEEQDPEQQFAVARVLAQPVEQGADSGPLQLVLERVLTKAAQGTEDSQEYASVLHLLHHACHLRDCRQVLLAADALPKLLQHVEAVLAPLSVSTAQVQAPAVVRPSTPVPAAPGSSKPGFRQLTVHKDDLELLLLVLEQLASSAVERGQDHRELQINVKALAEGLRALVERGMSKPAGTLARVLPHVAHGNAAAQAALLQHYAQSLDLEALDAAGAGTPQREEQQYELQSLLRLAQSIDEQGASPDSGFRHLVLQQGISQNLAGYVVQSFRAAPAAPADGASAQEPPEAQQPVEAAPSNAAQTEPGARAVLESSSEQWGKAAALPGVAVALELLAAVAKGHQAVCDNLAAQADLLPLLHQLETSSSAAVSVVPLAEALLEELVTSGGASCRDAVEGLRAATRERKRDMAVRSRQAMLASMGMTGGPGSGARPALPAAPAGSELAQAMAAMTAEEEPAEVTCMVCKEGYAGSPTQLLGAYCFCRRVPVADCGAEAPPVELVARPGVPAGQVQVHCTVSHFSLIHVACHQAARRADAALRHPKREWEGATLRNGETLCNNLVPVRGGCVSDAAYASAVATFWENLQAAPGPGRTLSSGSVRRAAEPALAASSPPARVAAVASDLASLLTRFAFRRSFSDESHGGGKHSNARLLLYLLQMGRYFADFAAQPELQDHHASLKQLLSWPPEARAGAAASSSSPRNDLPRTAFQLALSLLLTSPEEWSAALRSVLLNVMRGSACALASNPQQEPEAGPAQSATDPVGTSSSATRVNLVAAFGQLDEAARLQHFGPMLKLGALVNRLQGLKGSGANWHENLRVRLEDLPAALSSADDLLELLSELDDASSLQELLDCAELLPVALSEGIASVHDFVCHALQASPERVGCDVVSD